AVPDTPRHAAKTAIMGDIVEGAAGAVDLSVNLIAHAGIERVELRRGSETLETIRPYGPSDLGQRIRVVWSGAEYRGRGRDTAWRGQARFNGGAITRFETINLWNHERLLDQRGSDSVIFDTITTGNFMGFDAWVDGGTDLRVTTNHGDLVSALDAIGLDPIHMEAGGLARRLSVFRLPDAPLARELAFTRSVTLTDGQDDPIWIAVTTEDGYQAWSSPIYFI
ncbi:MAG: DUF3604 domain-containing protein, partial [Pseudomonadota bacterium]